MKPALRIAMTAMTLLALSACASEKVDPLKSPCVGLEQSPCGPKRLPAGNALLSPQIDQA